MDVATKTDEPMKTYDVKFVQWFTYAEYMTNASIDARAQMCTSPSRGQVT
jgi:hypothetical protein